MFRFILLWLLVGLLATWMRIILYNKREGKIKDIDGIDEWEEMYPRIKSPELMFWGAIFAPLIVVVLLLEYKEYK